MKRYRYNFLSCVVCESFETFSCINRISGTEKNHVNSLYTEEFPKVKNCHIFENVHYTGTYFRYLSEPMCRTNYSSCWHDDERALTMTPR